MRLSMARAFAVRDALTACGVPSTRILPLALGDVPGKDENTARITGGPTN
jgi:outer membrane protein OmpA-like peptidoglycan-associated protein